MEWYEREAATGFLSVLCACEKHVINLPADQVKKGWAGSCRESRCETIAANLNGVTNEGRNRTALAMPEVWRDLQFVRKRSRRNM